MAEQKLGASLNLLAFVELITESEVGLPCASENFLRLISVLFLKEKQVSFEYGLMRKNFSIFSCFFLFTRLIKSWFACLLQLRFICHGTFSSQCHTESFSNSKFME